METLIELALTFWMFTVAAVLILIGAVINLFDRRPVEVRFSAPSMPVLEPLPIATKGKGFWGAIIMWLLGTRKWKVARNWNYTLDGKKMVIPAGFEFDGASVPKFLASFLSPVGVLLIGGLVHDYGYKYATLMTRDKKDVGPLTQKDLDEIFRDINIQVNGFYFLNYLAYWSLRVAGFVAWNGHRKND